MQHICKSAQELISNTPLLELMNINKDLGARILAKQERFNPAVSAKDRVALAMIHDAENADC